MSPRPTLSRPLRMAQAAELLYAPIPLFLALTLPPESFGSAAFFWLLFQAAAAVAIAVGLGRGWWPARAGALLLAAWVLALAIVEGPAVVTAAFRRPDAVSVAALAVAAWAWLTQMAAFAGTLPDLARSGKRPRR